MKAIKLGQYRVILTTVSFMLIITASVTMYPFVLLALGITGFGWLILEITVVLKSVLALQRMVAYLIAPPDTTEENEPTQIAETKTRAIDINTGQESEKTLKKI